MNTLHERWLLAKAAEKSATDERRAIEDELIAQMGIAADAEGTTTRTDGPYTIKAVSRLTRTVDADLLQEVAAEHGLSDHLSALFRWKPELNLRAWEAASPAITGPLAVAITTKPGRPSFSITTNPKE